jgi:WD40 repeat protein
MTASAESQLKTRVPLARVVCHRLRQCRSVVRRRYGAWVVAATVTLIASGFSWPAPSLARRVSVPAGEGQGGLRSMVGPHPPVTALTPTPDGGGVLFGSQAGVFLIGPNRDAERAVATELDDVHHLSFSPDGHVLAVAGGSPGEFGTVELWSWPDRKRLRDLEGHDDLVYGAEWLEDSKTLVTAAADRTLRVWDATTATTTATLRGHSGPVLCVAISPDGRFICSGSTDQTIRVWDRSTFQLLRSLTNHLGPVHALTFRIPSDKSEPHQLVSAGGDATCRVWQPEIGRMVRIARLASPALSLAWKSDRSVLCGLRDGRVFAVDVDSGETSGSSQLSTGWINCLAAQRNERRIWIGDSLGRTFSTTESLAQ